MGDITPISLSLGVSPIQEKKVTAQKDLRLPLYHKPAMRGRGGALCSTPLPKGYMMGEELMLESPNHRDMESPMSRSREKGNEIEKKGGGRALLEDGA